MEPQGGQSQARHVIFDTDLNRRIESTISVLQEEEEPHQRRRHLYQPYQAAYHVLGRSFRPRSRLRLAFPHGSLPHALRRAVNRIASIVTNQTLGMDHSTTFLDQLSVFLQHVYCLWEFGYLLRRP